MGNRFTCNCQRTETNIGIPDGAQLAGSETVPSQVPVSTYKTLGKGLKAQVSGASSRLLLPELCQFHLLPWFEWPPLQEGMAQVRGNSSVTVDNWNCPPIIGPHFHCTGGNSHKNLTVFLYFSEPRVLMCSHNWPETHSVDQPGLNRTQKSSCLCLPPNFGSKGVLHHCLALLSLSLLILLLDRTKSTSWSCFVNSFEISWTN